MFTTKKMAVTGLFTAIICVLSQISIPLQPVPFTLSLFSIFLTGALLPPKYTLYATLSYLLLGAFGLPVFAGFRGGIQVIAGMTGGYILAYPIMAYLISVFYHHTKKRNMIALTMGMLLSLGLCYLIGSLWFTYVTDTSLSYAFTVCVLYFIPFDLLKLGLAVSFTPILRKLINS